MTKYRDNDQIAIALDTGNIMSPFLPIKCLCNMSRFAKYYV